MNLKELITKLQNLPDDKKKIILWTIVVAVGLVMGFFWIKGAVNGLSKISGSVQKIEIPNLNSDNK